ncbi:MAG: chromosomal replication initiator protein DnaA [Hyphomicrobiaceae bacterium]
MTSNVKTSGALKIGTNAADAVESPDNAGADARELDFARVQARLKASLGEELYSSWFARLEYEGLIASIVHLSVPTRFLKTWLQSHYLDALLEACRSEQPAVDKVQIALRQPGQPVQGRRSAAAEEAEKPQEQTVAHLRPVAGGNVMRRPASDTTIVAAAGATDGGGFQGSPLDRRYTFETFVVGGSNRLAHAAAKQVAETALSEPLRFNPLYIHSAVGLGKTHLLHAIAWEVKRRNPLAQVLYLTAERFRYRFVEALRSQDAMSFKERLRSIDLLLIDDMEFLHGEKTEQEFDSTLNSLLDGGKQVVVASARAPSDLETLDQRMRSRLSGGLVAEISTLDYELRLKVLERRAEEKRAADPTFHVGEEVIGYLAEKLTESGRELDGAITRLYAACHLTGTPITVDSVQHIIRDLVRGMEPKRIKVEDIIRVVSKHYGVSKADIMSQRRHRSVVWPRQVGMYLAKTLTARSLPEIGRRFGGRDHTTVLHAIRKIEGELKNNSRLRAEIEDLKKLLNS